MTISSSHTAGSRISAVVQVLSFPRTLQSGMHYPGLKTTVVKFLIRQGDVGVREREPPWNLVGGRAKGRTLVSSHFFSQLSWQQNKKLTMLTCFCWWRAPCFAWVCFLWGGAWVWKGLPNGVPVPLNYVGKYLVFISLSSSIATKPKKGGHIDSVHMLSLVYVTSQVKFSEQVLSYFFLKM